MVNVQLLMLCVLASGLPVLLTSIPIFIVSSMYFRIIYIIIMPLVLALSFVCVSGFLSIFFRSSITPGKLPRDLHHKLYRSRRFYGLLWSMIYYSGPVYYLILSVPMLKKITFYLFGFRGNQNFTVYPDTWIRDLPILSIDDGGYLSNKATLATNLCLGDNTILVDRISIGKRALVGHLAMVGPGAEMQEGSELGAGAVIGIRTRLCTGSKIGPSCCINHGVTIGSGSEIGAMTYIGIRAVIGEKVRIPGCSNIPPGSSVLNDEDVRRILEEERNNLKDTFSRTASIYNSRMRSGLMGQEEE